MQRISLVKQAHSLIKDTLQHGDIAIDATLGNGHDALFLTELVGPTGLVFGFDIQASAIENTRERFRLAKLESPTLILASHALMSEKIPEQYHGKVRTIMFNLGYLPGGDKHLITQTESTLVALQSAGKLLAKDGLLTIMAYLGHPGGDDEALKVAQWCSQLAPLYFNYQLTLSEADKPSAPKLFTIQKLT